MLILLHTSEGESYKDNFIKFPFKFVQSKTLTVIYPTLKNIFILGLRMIPFGHLICLTHLVKDSIVIRE